MNIFSIALAMRFVIAVTLLSLVSGCATASKPNQTENMLAASGFKIIPATTPGQLQRLQALPTGRISFVKHNGQVSFVYPDKANQQAYVGQNPQYDAYQKLVQEVQQAKVLGQMATDNVVASQANLQSEALNIESNDFWGEGVVWIVE